MNADINSFQICISFNQNGFLLASVEPINDYDCLKVILYEVPEWWNGSGEHHITLSVPLFVSVSSEHGSHRTVLCLCVYSESSGMVEPSVLTTVKVMKLSDQLSVNPSPLIITSTSLITTCVCVSSCVCVNERGSCFYYWVLFVPFCERKKEVKYIFLSNKDNF